MRIPTPLRLGKALFILLLACPTRQLAALEAVTDGNHAAPTSDSIPTLAGNATPIEESVLRKRKWTVGLFEGVFTTASFIGLNEAWYSNYPKQDFHLFDDWDEWMQTDKAGHLTST